jgi:hypothetical protein
MSQSAATAVPWVDRIEYDPSLLHPPVTGPPRYAAAAIKSTLHPNLLSQAFARSSPLPLAWPAEPPPPTNAADSGSLLYACGTDVGSARFPPAWYELE